MGSLYPEWHAGAKCVGMNSALFFGPSEEKRSMSPKQIRHAQSICEGCPVFETCLAQALRDDEQYGVWAGTSGRVRKRIQQMISAGVVTVEQVVEDYANGDRDRYERGVQRCAEGLRDAEAG